MSTIFITGAGRSGTTSVLKALELSKDTQIALEPEPTLNIESRELYERRLLNPYSVLARDVIPRVAGALDKGKIYIEKHISFVPFVPYLADMLDCKFIIPIRDGRDVVTSLLNWHNQMFPIIYQECQEPVILGEHAKQILVNQQGMDPFDYSLPRPLKDDPWFANWKHLSRFEMVSWYWAFINQYLFKQLEKLPPERYLIVNYTNPTTDSIKKVYDFIGLSDYNQEAVDKLLNKRVNSLENRIGEVKNFSRSDWTEEQEQRFCDIAFDTMVLLGFTESNCRPHPPKFGKWWQEDQSIDPNWYEKIYNYRNHSHETFKKWVKHIENQVGQFESIIDVGSGIGYGYSEFFKNKEFFGIDSSKKAIAWSNERNVNPKHQYICSDIIIDPPMIQGDLIFSQATIDNVYDIDTFLRAIAKMTKKILYVTNHRGYFNSMGNHRYLWDPKMQVCFNDLSPARVTEVLQAEGFQTIVVFPMKTYREDIKSETVVIASREKIDSSILMREHELYFDYLPYQVKPSEIPLQAVIEQINNGCAYFSEGGLNLANNLQYFENILDDLKRMPLRCIGKLKDLVSNQEKINTAIRIDVDMDLVTSREIAKIAAKKNIPLTFYVLHTAPYYGSIQDGIFYRNEANAELYKDLQQLGSEVGLHIDPFELYLNHGIDGAAAVKEELAWLRSQGLDISGTSSHNCAPVYGVENFEIFKGRSINKQTFYNRNYAYAPLEVLDEKELSLDYEASGAVPATRYDSAIRSTYLDSLPKGDFLRNEDWFRTYILDNPYCTWGFDFNIWLLGKDLWAIAGHTKEKQQKIFHFGVSWASVQNFLAELDNQAQVVFTLHAIYFGYRLKVGDQPR